MLIGLAVILFAVSVLNGAWAITSPDARGVQLLVNIFCGILSVVTGYFGCLLVMILGHDGEPVRMHGIFQHVGLLLGGFAPGILGYSTATWFKRRAGSLNAEPSVMEV